MTGWTDRLSCYVSLSKYCMHSGVILGSQGRRKTPPFDVGVVLMCFVSMQKYPKLKELTVKQRQIEQVF